MLQVHSNVSYGMDSNFWFRCTWTILTMFSMKTEKVCSRILSPSARSQSQLIWRVWSHGTWTEFDLRMVGATWRNRMGSFPNDRYCIAPSYYVISSDLKHTGNLQSRSPRWGGWRQIPPHFYTSLTQSFKALPPVADSSKTKTENFCSGSTFLRFPSIPKRYFIDRIRNKMFPDNKCCHFVTVESLFQSWFLRFSCNFCQILRVMICFALI